MRRVVTASGLAFLAGFGFHIVVAGGRPGTPTPTPTPTPSALAAGTDGQDSREVATRPTRIVEGVPAGFASTEAGAVAAATSYVTTGQALIDMDPLAVEDAVRQMAAEATADRQVVTVLGDLRRLRDVLSAGTGPITFRQAVLAVHAAQFEPGRARVAVWNVGVLSREGIASPQAGWQVSTFDLVWERDDWRIEAETTTPGPAPVPDDSTVPATSEQLASLLDGFTPLAATPSINEVGR